MTDVVLPATDRCRSCFVPIAWAITEKRRRMPLDPVPVDDGNVAVTSPTLGVLYAHVVRGDELIPAEPGPRYVSHFTTCPKADQHRGGRR